MVTEELVRALQRNDKSAWEEFFRQFDSMIRAVIGWSKWHFATEVRDDLFQTIRLSLLEGIPRLQDASRLPGFVKRVCVNRCIDEVRRQVKQREIMVSAYRRDGDNWSEIDLKDDRNMDPVRLCVLSERAAALKAAMQEIDNTCRRAVRQFYMEGRSYKSMAKAEGVSINTVGSRLARCLAKLRKLLMEKEGRTLPP